MILGKESSLALELCTRKLYFRVNSNVCDSRMCIIKATACVSVSANMCVCMYLAKNKQKFIRILCLFECKMTTTKALFESRFDECNTAMHSKLRMQLWVFTICGNRNCICHKRTRHRQLSMQQKTMP